MPAIDLEAVAAFADIQHKGQARRHGGPYATHPRRVRVLVEDLADAIGYPIDDELRAAAHLHDVLEDGDVNEAGLRARFGDGVANRVACLTKPPAQTEGKATQDAAYFERLRTAADDGVRLVKVADRLHNLSELHLAKDPTRAARYLEETERLISPLAQAVRNPALSRGLCAALHDALALTAHLCGLRARTRDGTPRGLYALVDVGPTTDLEHAANLARAAAEGGAALLQLRVKGLEDKAALLACEGLLPAARAGGAPVLVNDRADLARLAGADGVHVGQSDLPPRRLRVLLEPSALVGKSSHTAAQATSALEEGGIDYIAFGPVFPSPTKHGHAEVTGLTALGEVAAASPLPVCAIGGVTSPSRMAAVARAGAALGAVISGIAAAEDPAFQARRLAIAHAAVFAMRSAR